MIRKERRWLGFNCFLIVSLQVLLLPETKKEIVWKKIEGSGFCFVTANLVEEWIKRKERKP